MPKGRDFLYDPKILEVIQRGSLSVVTLRPLTKDNAQALRMKIYRHKDHLLMATTHSLHEAAKLIVVKIHRLSHHEWAIIVQPKDIGFEAAFANAGIATSDDEPPSLD